MAWLPGRRKYYNAHEVAVALLNLQWYVKNRDGWAYPDSDTLVYGDGGTDLGALFDEEGPGISEYREMRARGV